MSVESEILRIQQNIADTYAAVAEKGGEVPLHPTSANLAAAVASIPGASIPTGGIIIWSGAADAVPDGWALCDGTNGTPDLRNRFVMGASDTSPVLVFESTNKGIGNSESVLTLTAKKSLNMDIFCEAISERGYDYLRIMWNTSTLLDKLGNDQNNNWTIDRLSQNLYQNNTLKFIYHKDSSGNFGADNGAFWLSIDGHGDVKSEAELEEYFTITDGSPYTFSRVVKSKKAIKSPKNIGGRLTSTLAIANMPQHNHDEYVAKDNSSVYAKRPFLSGSTTTTVTSTIQSTEIPAGTKITNLTTGSVGAGATISNVPAYMALAYIMKL